MFHELLYLININNNIKHYNIYLVLIMHVMRVGCIEGIRTH